MADETQQPVERMVQPAVQPQLVQMKIIGLKPNDPPPQLVRVVGKHDTLWAVLILSGMFVTGGIAGFITGKYI